MGPALPTAAVKLGYEPALLARLSPAQRQQLNALGRAWLASCLLLGLPMAVAVYKTEHGILLAIAAFLGATLMTLNMLRLVVAGSGIAPHLPVPRAYRPTATTGLIIGMLALLMSQPAQLLLASPEADAAVQAHRAELVEAHRALLSSMGTPAHDGFAEQTAECEFVVLRLAQLWQTPTRTVLYSGLYLLVVLAPFLLMRTLYLPAVQAYEHARHRRAVVGVARAERETRAAVSAALSAYDTFAGGPKDLGERGGT